MEEKKMARTAEKVGNSKWGIRLNLVTSSQVAKPNPRGTIQR